MRVLVCGDRNWADRVFLYVKLNELHRVKPITCVIDGGARGADTMAYEWAKEHNIKTERYFANWEKHGRAAGPIRNNKMLKEGKPECVVAFHDNIPDSKGTKNMLELAKADGIPATLNAHHSTVNYR